MNWINKLERKYGRHAIKHLIQYIVIANAITYVVLLAAPLLRSRLMLVPAQVLQGEVWRLVTFLFIPPNSSPIFIFFALYIIYMYGTGLEQYWGSFKFNMYYFIGVIVTIVVAMMITIVFKSYFSIDNSYLNLSLLLAFATLYPDVELRLFFILPVKIKYIGWFTAAILTLNFFMGTIPTKLIIMASVVNYFIFFTGQFLHRKKHQAKQKSRLKEYQSQYPNSTKNKVIKVSFHKCTVCSITELDNPNEEFRYCSKCEGHHEYCSKHILEHEHKKTLEH